MILDIASDLHLVEGQHLCAGSRHQQAKKGPAESNKQNRKSIFYLCAGPTNRVTGMSRLNLHRLAISNGLLSVRQEEHIGKHSDSKQSSSSCFPAGNPGEVRTSD
jgi:hypothetical protein